MVILEHVRAVSCSMVGFQQLLLVKVDSCIRMFIISSFGFLVGWSGVHSSCYGSLVTALFETCRRLVEIIWNDLLLIVFCWKIFQDIFHSILF